MKFRDYLKPFWYGKCGSYYAGQICMKEKKHSGKHLYYFACDSQNRNFCRLPVGHDGEHLNFDYEFIHDMDGSASTSVYFKFYPEYKRKVKTK